MQLTQTNIKLAVLVASLAALSACGGDDAVEPGIETLGTTFQQAFSQGPNDTPIDVTNADLALNLRADPFEL